MKRCRRSRPKRTVPPNLLRRLAQHPGARRQIALRPQLPLELIEEIISLGSARTFAANSSLPASVRARLATHPQAEVRAALAANAPDETRRYAEPSPSIRLYSRAYAIS